MRKKNYLLAWCMCSRFLFNNKTGNFTLLVLKGGDTEPSGSQFRVSIPVSEFLCLVRSGGRSTGRLVVPHVRQRSANERERIRDGAPRGGKCPGRAT